MPNYKQRLLFNGVALLEDDRSLKEYGIKHNCQIKLELVSNEIMQKYNCFYDSMKLSDSDIN